MDSFFERLLAENDPARLATLAEQAPEPPDLSGDGDDTGWADAAAAGPARGSVQDEAAAGQAGGATDVDAADVVAAEAGEANESGDSGQAMVGKAVADAGPTSGADAPDGVDAEPEASEAVDALAAEAAAEAEALATEGLDMVGPDRWPAAVMGDSPASGAATSAGSPAQAQATAAPAVPQSRLFVTGLTSVAGISAFKGAVGGLPGVRSVSVSSGERGVFIFSVSHDPDADIAQAVTGLSGFAVRVTEASGDSLSLTAHEPAA
jgi:hypothetical protein